MAEPVDWEAALARLKPEKPRAELLLTIPSMILLKDAIKGRKEVALLEKHYGAGWVDELSSRPIQRCNVISKRLATFVSGVSGIDPDDALAPVPGDPKNLKLFAAAGFRAIELASELCARQAMIDARPYVDHALRASGRRKIEVVDAICEYRPLTKEAWEAFGAPYLRLYYETLGGKKEDSAAQLMGYPSSAAYSQLTRAEALCDVLRGLISETVTDAKTFGMPGIDGSLDLRTVLDRIYSRIVALHVRLTCTSDDGQIKRDQAPREPCTQWISRTVAEKVNSGAELPSADDVDVMAGFARGMMPKYVAFFST
jgi:hypothetical protein